MEKVRARLATSEVYYYNIACHAMDRIGPFTTKVAAARTYIRQPLALVAVFALLFLFPLGRAPAALDLRTPERPPAGVSGYIISAR